jgi:hypothetical protein
MANLIFFKWHGGSNLIILKRVFFVVTLPNYMKLILNFRLFINFDHPIPLCAAWTFVGIRRPDIVASRGREIAVVDVQVVAPNPSLGSAHRKKVVKYHDEAQLTR